MKIFTPMQYVKSVHDINFDKLKELGIKCIICDLDNTLVGHDVKLPTEEVITLIKEVVENGFTFVIFSNNTKNRVSYFCEKLDVKYYFSSKKPLSLTYKRIVKDMNFKKEEICSIGDQLLTDVLGANIFGIRSILVDPVQEKDLIWTKFNRMLENIVYKRLDKKNILKKGKYNG